MTPHPNRLAFTLLVSALSLLPQLASAILPPEGERPAQFDVRGFDGVPKGTELRQPDATQLKAIASLETQAGGPLTISYNGLTATPRHLFSHSGYLSGPSSAPPEEIAREFLDRWQGIWRFSDDDLENLRLKSRATLQEGTTVMVFEQQVDGVPVFKGEVLVNVNRAGRVISVGNDNFPGITVENAFAMSPAAAVTAAAAGLGVSGFAPQPLGTKNVLRTYGDLPHEFEEGTRFSGGVFRDDIVVTRVIFPLGQTGRAAYQFTINTPQYNSMLWDNIVDAETGTVLRRISLTSFQAGTPGGGPQNSRRASFRPDIQNMVESIPTTSGAGKVFDGAPTATSGAQATGRRTRAELPKQPGPRTPEEGGYVADTDTSTVPRRGFRRGLMFGRTQFPFAELGTPLYADVYGIPFGQVVRGFPTALNPSPGSPFGWFYLPTNPGGAEITDAQIDANRTSTRDFRYDMHPAAKTRNKTHAPANSPTGPTGDGDQPFSASLTPLPANVTLADGRVLSSVWQSHYTEGNNVLTADDKDNDDEVTHGIKGFAADLQFTRPYFDFANRYEFEGESDPDVFPATLALFYYNNVLHDYHYSIGFTEATWNFQQDNFGNGGAGGDAVSTQVQDGSGTNNANMSTQADGIPPRMQMYNFTQATYRRADGDLDFDIVAHELFHGVSNRSVGKGGAGCLGNPVVGESGGMGEGWSDFSANSAADDDVPAEYPTGRFDIAIRKLPSTNFRYSYRNITGTIARRDRQPPDTTDRQYLPFETHEVGENWAAILWSMRELMVVKQEVDGAFPGIFFDGSRRMGGGTPFYIGYRQMQSVDAAHPIDYRVAFNTGNPNSINPYAHIVRPGQVAAEIAARKAANDPNPRGGPLATAVARGGRLADTLVMRGMQLAPCNPTFVEMRDSILLADSEVTGGENRAIIWRAFASHGVGLLAKSSGGTADDQGSQAAPVIVEDFSVPAEVTACEQFGPLPPPPFALSNAVKNQVAISITPVAGAATYVILRGNSANGPFTKIAEFAATQTSYADDNGGQGLPGGQTFYYQVHATRNAECVSGANTNSIQITLADPIDPAPSFVGIQDVSDPRLRDRLILSWHRAISAKPNANIVYDIYRVSEVNHGTSQNDPTFTPLATNRIAQGVTGTSYVDTGLALTQMYYYIVQARDLTNGKIDTNNTGNTRVRWNAPTVVCVLGSAPFALQTFEAAPATPTPTPSRFSPPLTESGSNPDQASATFQRITVAGLGHPSVGKMYAPDFSPGHERDNCTTSDPAGTHCGGQSDFYTQIGPIPGPNPNNPALNTPALTATSVMEFDNTIFSEDRFDGGVIEIKVGEPFAPGDATPFPSNTTPGTYDLGDYIIEGRYNSKLDGLLPFTEVYGSALQGRRAYAGIKPLHHVMISLRAFAPGGVHNPNGLPVFIRFRMTSDAATAPALDTGWFIDNLVIHNLGTNGAIPIREVVSRKTHGEAGTFDLPLPLTGTQKGVESRSGGANGDHTVIFKFGAALTAVGNATVTGGGSVSSHGYDQTSQEYTVHLTGVPNARDITVTLTGVSDTCGNTGVTIPVQMGVLHGDVNGTRIVDGNDVSATQSKIRQRASSTNFQADVNTTGLIDGNDVSAVQSRTRTRLP